MFQIVWTDQAINQLTEILEFWNENNQSEEYSEKILNEIIEYEFY